MVLVSQHCNQMRWAARWAPTQFLDIFWLSPAHVADQEGKVSTSWGPWRPKVETCPMGTPSSSWNISSAVFHSENRSMIPWFSLHSSSWNDKINGFEKSAPMLSLWKFHLKTHYFLSCFRMTQSVGQKAPFGSWILLLNSIVRYIWQPLTDSLTFIWQKFLAVLLAFPFLLTNCSGWRQNPHQKWMLLGEFFKG